MVNKTFIAAVFVLAFISSCEGAESSSPSAPGTLATEEITDLEHAALAGNSEAMYSLFLAIFKNANSPSFSEEERVRGLQWLEKAGKLGNWRAARVLADSYKYGGFGYPKNPKEEAYWRGVFEKNRTKNMSGQ